MVQSTAVNKIFIHFDISNLLIYIKLQYFHEIKDFLSTYMLYSNHKLKSNFYD